MSMITELNYRGKQFPLYLNGAGLFNIYGKFGQEKGIFELLEQSGQEGFETTIWILCELSRQGTAYSRFMGLEAERPLSYMEASIAITPAEFPEIKTRVAEALMEGFRREHEDRDDSDPWLLEFEQESQKKKKQKAERKSSQRQHIFRRLLLWAFRSVKE